MLQTLDWVNHKYGIIHRDLKPQNVLFDKDGIGYISDWGLSKVIQEKLHKGAEELMKQKNLPKDSCKTEAGSFLGTVTYASPEQILGKPNIDFRSDIYSIGCILYAIETGHPPFVGSSVDLIIRQHLCSPPPRLGGLFSRTKFGFEKIIQKCLQKEASKRYQKYSDMIEDVVKVAFARGFDISSNSISERSPRHAIGIDEYKKTQVSKYINDFKKNFNNDKNADAFLNSFFEEFYLLVNLKEWDKAKRIMECLYFPRITCEQESWNLWHTIALNYSLCLTRCGAPEDAEKILVSLHNTQNLPDSYFINYELTLMYLNKHAEMIDIGIEGNKKFPNDPGILGNLALAYMFTGEHQKALEALLKIPESARDIKQLEDLACIYISLANEAGEKNFLEMVNLYGKALSIITKILQINPRHLSIFINQAQVFSALGYFEKSLNIYSENVNPSDIKNQCTQICIPLIAQTLFKTKQYDMCINFCNDFRDKVNESSIERIRMMAYTEKVWSERGEKFLVFEAEQYFANVVNNNSIYYQDYIYCAKIYAASGNYSQAKEVMEKAKANFDNNWLIFYHEAKILRKENNLQDALKSIFMAIKIAPYQSLPLVEMSKIYKSIGDTSNENLYRIKAKHIEEERGEIIRKICKF